MRYFEDHPVLAREALESLSTAIALIDERGAIGDLNVRLTCLSGYAADDLLGQDIRMIVPGLRPDSPLFCRSAQRPPSPDTAEGKCRRCHRSRLPIARRPRPVPP